MTAERWALITSVFQAASERPVAERIAYLDEACRGDELLQTRELAGHRSMFLTVAPLEGREVNRRWVEHDQLWHRDS